MTVLVTCKFEDDSIKVNALSFGQHFLHYKSIHGKIFHHSRASNSKVNSPIWLKIKILQDFMPVLIICKFDEEPIKNEDTIDQTTFSP